MSSKKLTPIPVGEILDKYKDATESRKLWVSRILNGAPDPYIHNKLETANETIKNAVSQVLRGENDFMVYHKWDADLDGIAFFDMGEKSFEEIIPILMFSYTQRYGHIRLFEMIGRLLKKTCTPDTMDSFIDYLDTLL